MRNIKIENYIYCNMKYAYQLLFIGAATEYNFIS